MPAEGTPHADDSLLVRPLLAVTEWCLRAPWTVLTLALALALVCVGITVQGLSFKSSRLDLLNPRSEYNRRWLEYLAEFGDRDDAVVVVRADQPSDVTAAIDGLAAQLQAQPELFESIFFQRDLRSLKAKALHFLPPEQLTGLERQVSQLAMALSGTGEAADVASQLAKLNEQFTPIAPASPQRATLLAQEYLRVTGPLLAVLGGASPGTTPPASAPLPGSLNQFEPRYLLAEDSKIGFVLLRLIPQPLENAPNVQAIDRLRSIIAAAKQQHPSVWIGLTGMPVIEHDEMQASQFDMLWTSILSMVFVLFLYLASYGGFRHAMLVNLLLLLGTAYSFGFVTLAVGHLNILSAAFSAVLIGLGIDFAIHYVACYLKLRQEGLHDARALLRTAADVGPGVVTGGVTTAAAFFMAAMTDFIGVRELGLVAGGGILLCVVTTVIVLPPLVLLVDRRWPLVRVHHILPAGQWFQWPLQRPRLVIALGTAATLLLATGASRLRYDHNLLNLQPKHVESADIERQLFTQLEDSVWYAVSVCESREELHARQALFDKLPVVSKTEEIASLLRDSSPEQSQRVAALCRHVATLPAQTPQPPPVNIARLKQELGKAASLLAEEVPHDASAARCLGQALALLSARPEQETALRVTAGQAALASASLAAARELKQIADPVPPAEQDIPRELKDRFLGASGTWLLKVYARGNIWNMREMQAFVQAVESVDPRVTGHPVQTYYASRHMQQSYVWAGLYALVAVLILLWLDFRSVAHALLAMVPPALGFVQMCGLIGWLDIPLNPANMIVLPLILGIGVDHGVHLVHLWRQQRGRFALGDSTAVAVLLTATTTTASFGALILARHQGLQSLGQVLTLGVTTCLASSILIFPAVLASLSKRNKVGPGKPERAKGDAEIQAAAIEHEQPSARPGTSAVLEVLCTEYSVPGTRGAVVSDPPASETSSLIEPPLAAEQPVVFAPAPVTDEEVAALLDCALLPRRLRLENAISDGLANEESANGTGPFAPLRPVRHKKPEAA